MTGMRAAMAATLAAGEGTSCRTARSQVFTFDRGGEETLRLLAEEVLPHFA